MFGEQLALKPFASYFTSEVLAKVFENSIKGHNTRGVDGQTPEHFLRSIDKKFAGLSLQITSGNYKFSRFKEKLILKGAKRLPRQVFIPTIRDRIVLRCLHNFLSERFPDSQTPLPHACIKAIRKRMTTATPDDCFLRVDIKDFYPSIVHSKLLAEITPHIEDKICLRLVRDAIKTSADKNKKSRRGVPQGLSISNCLANIMLTKVDAKLVQMFGGENYFRYVDDVVIITKATTATSDFDAVASVIKESGLVVHKLPVGGKSTSKSQICSMSDGVEYLGFRLRTAGISVRPASLRRMYDRIANQMTALSYGRAFPRVAFKTDLMISGCILNGKRYGWLHFFQQSDDTSQLVNLDRFVTALTKQNAKVPGYYQFKKFLKAYHEIRYRSETTKYIPNFDKADLGFKKETLKKFGFSPGLDEMLIEEIDLKFFSLVSKMAHELEKDVLGVTS